MEQDEKFMLRCIKLAEEALDKGELPFSSILVRDGKIIAEAGNMAVGDNDITSHAEILVLRQGQRMFGLDLSACTIYSNCEPCPMCSFSIRELRVSRVVFGIESPIMGGYSRWDILQDSGLEALPDYYGRPPELIGGFMKEEVDKTFERHDRLKRQSRQ